MALLSRLPYVSAINFFCCAWIWLGSFFAAWHYKYLGGGVEGESGRISLHQGILVGALSGIIAALAGAILNYFFLTSMGVESIVSMTAELFAVEEALVWESLPSGDLPVEMSLSIIDFAVNSLVYTFVGAIGGGIGATFLSRGASLRESDQEQ